MSILKCYRGIVIGRFMTNLAYPLGFFLTFIGNLVYIIVLYFLWKAIYGDTPTLHGMTFRQTFVYLTLAGSIVILFKTGADWSIARDILSGSIILDLTKPLDFQSMALAHEIGALLFNGLVITIPSMLVVLVFVGGDVLIGINIPFFLASLIGAFLLSFSIDFIVGLLAFYTESLWGISVAKEVLISFLAGALIPLPFFPQEIQRLLYLLPFQAIYSTPLQIATNATLATADYLGMIGIQVFWAILFIIGSRVIYSRVIKVLTVNGG